MGLGVKNYTAGNRGQARIGSSSVAGNNINVNEGSERTRNIIEKGLNDSLSAIDKEHQIRERAEQDAKDRQDKLIAGDITKSQLEGSNAFNSQLSETHDPEEQAILIRQRLQAIDEEQYDYSSINDPVSAQNAEVSVLNYKSGESLRLTNSLKSVEQGLIISTRDANLAAIANDPNMLLSAKKLEFAMILADDETLTDAEAGEMLSRLESEAVEYQFRKDLADGQIEKATAFLSANKDSVIDNYETLKNLLKVSQDNAIVEETLATILTLPAHKRPDAIAGVPAEIRGAVRSRLVAHNNLANGEAARVRRLVEAQGFIDAKNGNPPDPDYANNPDYLQAYTGKSRGDRDDTYKVGERIRKQSAAAYKELFELVLEYKRTTGNEYQGDPETGEGGFNDLTETDQLRVRSLEWLGDPKVVAMFNRTSDKELADLASVNGAEYQALTAGLNDSQLDRLYLRVNNHRKAEIKRELELKDAAGFALREGLPDIGYPRKDSDNPTNERLYRELSTDGGLRRDLLDTMVQHQLDTGNAPTRPETNQMLAGLIIELDGKPTNWFQQNIWGFEPSNIRVYEATAEELSSQSLSANTDRQITAISINLGVDVGAVEAYIKQNPDATLADAQVEFDPDGVYEPPAEQVEQPAAIEIPDSYIDAALQHNGLTREQYTGGNKEVIDSSWQAMPDEVKKQW